MDIKQIEIEIKQLQSDMKISFRRTVDDAIRIGELLTDVKKQLTHGEFMPWCNIQRLKQWSIEKYIKVYEYNDKMVNITNLSEAYKLIESEENRKKQLEFQKQSKRINEYKKTGVKPENWNKATDDYRLRKERDDSEYRERKRKAFEEKKAKHKKSEYDNSNTEEILNGLDDLMKANEQKEQLLNKMRLTGDNSEHPIYSAIMDYLTALNESERLEACHNIIKMCKGIANELQVRSQK